MKAPGHDEIRNRIRQHRKKGGPLPAGLRAEWKAVLSLGAKMNAQKRAAKKARRGGSAKPLITKTVQYTYNPADDVRLQAFYNSPEWRMVRYEILRRDGAKCACCRTTEKPVHVDHIKPLRVFWALRLDPNNLQVLCEDCNVGKGTRHADDWR